MCIDRSILIRARVGSNSEKSFNILERFDERRNRKEADHLGVLTRALRNVSRRKIRVALIVIAMGFSLAIMISIPAGIIANQVSAQSLAENYNDTITNMQVEINETSALIEVQASSGSGMFSGSPSDRPPGEGFGQQQTTYINETVVADITSIEGIKDIVQFLATSSNETTSETISGPGGRTFTISRPLYTISGVSLDSSFIANYSILPTNMTAGRNLREGDSGVLLMSSNLTEYFGVEVDDEVEIYGEYFTVVGIYEQESQGRMESRTVYMNISDVQTITGLDGYVSTLDLYAEDSSYVDGIAEVIEAMYSDLRVTTYYDRLSQLQNMQTMYNQTLTNAQATLSQTQAVALQEIGVAVAATSLIVLVTMLYTVRERTHEIGVLKAIGFSNLSIMSQLVLEGIFISLIAGVVGIGIGTVAAPVLSSLLLPSINTSAAFGQGNRQTMIPGASFSAAASSTATAIPDVQLMAIALGASVLLGALGTLYPAWRASRTSPMEALRYE